MVSFTKFAILALTAGTINGALVPTADFQKALDVFGLEPPSQLTVSFGGSSSNFPGPDIRPIPGNSPVSQCDANQPQLLNLQKLIIDPNPPERGQNITFVATGFLSKDVEEGAYVDVEVKYGFIKLVHETFDLCEEITKVELECPVLKGEQVIRKTVEIPAEVPPGRYSVVARAYTNKDVFITCLTATIDFPAA